MSIYVQPFDETTSHSSTVTAKKLSVTLLTVFALGCDTDTSNIANDDSTTQEPAHAQTSASVRVTVEPPRSNSWLPRLPVDEGCPTQTPDVDHSSVGEPCGLGVCSGGQILPNGRCSTWEKQAQQEVCDGLDNDCDGLTDEDFESLGQSCGTPFCPGSVICNADGSSSCDVTLTAELCDGLDNDCDGLTDEDFQPGGVLAAKYDGGDFPHDDAGKGLDESCGTGVCQGRIVCSTDNALTCSAKKTWGLPETCDGQDNDCDGLTDEDFADKLFKPCTVSAGPCIGAAGLWRCNPTYGFDIRCEAKDCEWEG